MSRSAANLACATCWRAACARSATACASPAIDRCPTGAHLGRALRRRPDRPLRVQDEITGTSWPRSNRSFTRPKAFARKAARPEDLCAMGNGDPMRIFTVPPTNQDSKPCLIATLNNRSLSAIPSMRRRREYVGSFSLLFACQFGWSYQWSPQVKQAEALAVRAAELDDSSRMGAPCARLCGHRQAY